MIKRIGIVIFTLCLLFVAILYGLNNATYKIALGKIALPDIGAFAGHPRGKTGFFQFVEGLAGGHAADAELTRQLVLGGKHFGKMTRCNALEQVFLDVDVFGDSPGFWHTSSISN